MFSKFCTCCQVGEDFSSFAHLGCFFCFVLQLQCVSPNILCLGRYTLAPVGHHSLITKVLRSIKISVYRGQKKINVSYVFPE